MPRLRANRWRAFVLTLCFFATCCGFLALQLPSAASADQSSSIEPTDGAPSAPVVGDPDVPMGPGDGKAGKSRVVRLGSNQVVPQNGAVSTAVGAVPSSVLMDRVHLFLLSLRSLYLRF